MEFHKKLYQELVRSDRLPAPIRGSIKLLSHWVFQGMRRMDTSERIFKSICTAVFSLVFYQMLKRASVAIILGHSLNFVLNSHAVSALRVLNISFYNEWDNFNAFATDLLEDISSRDWVNTVYVIGSVNENRNEWEPGSDLDVIVIRNDGIINGVKAVTGALCIRFRATINLFPIDIYFFDSGKTLDNRLIDDSEDLSPYNDRFK